MRHQAYGGRIERSLQVKLTPKNPKRMSMSDRQEHSCHAEDLATTDGDGHAPADE